MTIARLHRRLTGLMGLTALAALAAGASFTPGIVLAGAALLVGLMWTADGRLARALEHGSRAVALAIFAWVLYVGLVLGGDVLEPGLVLLFVLLAAESLRPIEASNDFRLYSLSFAVVIGATAYYPGVAFGLAFTGYIVLTTLALMVGHLRRQAERFRIPDLRVGRSFLAATAALSLVTLLASVVIFVAFPRMPRSWFGQGRAPGGTMAGFSDAVSLGEHGGRMQPNPEVVFRVEFEGAPPSDATRLYWRGLSFHGFDGIRWSRARNGRTPDHLGMSHLAIGAEWGDGRMQYRIYGGPPGAKVLFGSPPVLAVRRHSGIRPRLRWNGDFEYEGWDVPVYSVLSGTGIPSDARLRAAGDGAPPDSALHLQLPRLDPRVAVLADSLTRPHASRIDRVRAVEGWLRREFRYTLDLPASARQATLEHFLFERRAGHCEYFSTALAVLLRSAGIPARNVNGFMGGEWNARAGYLAVTGNNAHSWVEVWFPEIGWVPFDATPPAARDEMLLDAGSSALWPVLFWLDAVQFEWYRWVLAYDLDRQLDLVASLGDRFSGRGLGSPGPLPWRDAFPWAFGALGLGGALWLVGRSGARRHPPVTRGYLRMRRRYQRAGYPVPDVDAPLAFLDRLQRAGAPGMDDARGVVNAYLDERFAGRPLGREEMRGFRDHLARVRRALGRRGGRTGYVWSRSEAGAPSD